MFLTPDKTYVLNGVTVKDFLLTAHNPNDIEMPTRRTKNLLGVTIHNTEKINAAKGTTMSEQYARATVNGNMGLTRVHYYVDDTEAWHTLPDSWCGWHAADGNGNGNTATIAIEVIGSSEKAETNAAKLAAYLLQKYNLTIANLFTHTYWLNVKDGKSGKKDYLCTLKNPYKTCPIYIIPHWDNFLSSVNSFMEKKKLYYVQVGAFSSKENAQKYLDQVKKIYPKAYIKTE